MADVAMPRLSDSMEEGTILKWLKSDGDEVKRGEELVEIETDKANMTYEADSDGVLNIVAKEGDTLPVGETIARLGDGSDGGGGEEEPAVEQQPAEEQPAEEQPAAEEQQDEEPSGNGRPSETPEPAPAEAQAGTGNGDGRVKASPVAKRMAREMGVELGQLKGSGPGGRIVKADVEAAAKGGTATEAPPEEDAAAAPEQPAPRSLPRRRSRTCRPPWWRAPATARPAVATSPIRTSRGSSRRSRAGWRSPRRPRPTSC
jgi:pyruvate dehydrogenase E2 component (dihydrolipoamide acetyltransferase)